MTLIEEGKVVEQCSEESKVKACSGVVGVIAQASEQGRVVNGVHKCAKILQSDPNAVMLCILPEPSSEEDITVKIEHTLIEAHCWENGIRIMKVDSQKKLEMLILDNTKPTDDSLCDDFSCVLVEFPKTQNVDSKQAEIEWKTIDEFYKKMLKHGVPHWHVIELPG